MIEDLIEGLDESKYHAAKPITGFQTVHPLQQPDENELEFLNGHTLARIMNESESGYHRACKIEDKNERQKVLRDTLDSIKKMLTVLQDKQNGEEEQRPKYLARKDDGAVWSLNNDGITYSHMEHKEKYPDNIHHQYFQDTLLKCGFSPVTEEDFPKLQALGKEYYEYLSWTSRSDGHGGSKGGTIEEFRKYKSKLKK